jgi:Rrf2 family transcriptional regulator, iron-sulfur cluster assembly transcription factor
MRALAYLASQPPGKLSPKDEIAVRESIPAAFLGKLLTPLCRDRIIRSRKGLRGGYELLVPPQNIALLTVVRLVDGEPLKDCLLEDHLCCGTCKLHNRWSEMREQLLSFLERITVADLVEAGPTRKEQRDLTDLKVFE